MIFRCPSVDVDASARCSNSFKYLTLMWPWLWSHDLQNLISSPVASTTSIKVWRNSTHWIVRYCANRTHAQTHKHTHRQTNRKHNASNTGRGGAVWIQCRMIALHVDSNRITHSTEMTTAFVSLHSFRTAPATVSTMCHVKDENWQQVWTGTRRHANSHDLDIRPFDLK